MQEEKGICSFAAVLCKIVVREKSIGEHLWAVRFAGIHWYLTSSVL
jgi:hypothetical protein